MIKEEVDARKQVYNGEDVWQVVAAAAKIYVASGKKTLEFDPKTADKGELLKKITGRTGNLRAPTLKVGATFFVGFNSEIYQNL